MNKDENLTPALEARLGTEVGFLSVTKPQNYTQHYEVAAWSTQLRSDVGTFPVILQLHPLFPYHLVLRAQLPATVVSSYTQALFGGVAIGTDPQGDKHRDVGKRDAFGMSIPFAEAAAKIVGSVDHEVRWVLNEDVAAMSEDYLRACFKTARTWASRVDRIFDQMAAGVEVDPEDQYLLSKDEDSRLSSLSFAHERVAKTAKLLRELIGRFGARNNYPQNYSREHADAYIKGLCHSCYKSYLPGFVSRHAEDCTMKEELSE